MFASKTLPVKWMRHGAALKNVFRFQSSKPYAYVHETGSRPLIAATIGQFVDRAAERYPDRESVVDWSYNIRWTFPQLKQQVDRLAAGFLKLGLNKNDRIGLWAPNRYEWIATQLAAAKAGLILVTLNPGYQPMEVGYCIQKVGMRAIVAPDKFKTQEYYQWLTSLVPEIAQTKPGMKFKSQKYSHLDTLILMADEQLPGAFKLEEVWNSGGSEEISRLVDLSWRISFEDAAMIKFTSGTTGSPKGVTLSHHNILNGAYSTVATKFDAEKERHRVCATAPFFHVFGCVTTLIGNLVNGATTIIPLPVFHSPTILKCTEKEKCTVLMGTPTMFIDLMHNLESNPTDTSSLKIAIISGAPVSPVLMSNLMKKFKCTGFCGGYGSTELSGGAFDCHPDDPIEEKTFTAGHAHYYTEVKIVDSNGRVVPMGTAGEIWVRGYKVMMGYWEDEEKTREVITKDGWYRTGDVGILNENRTLTVVDRITDMIIRGGENIYPTEIEGFLLTNPKIIECQVIGAPDERLGEVVCAWVRLRPQQTMTEDEVKEFCAGKISRAKIPAYVYFAEDFPRTLSGKVKKFVLKEKMQQMLAKKA